MSQPSVARGRKPHSKRTVGSDGGEHLGTHRVQPAAHILQPGAEMRESVGFKIDITKSIFTRPAPRERAGFAASLYPAYHMTFGIGSDWKLLHSSNSSRTT